MMRAIQRVTAPLTRRVRLMVARGVVSLVNDALKVQGLQVQLLPGEVRDMERFQNYGFTSHPHPGAEACAAFVGGNRDHGIVLAVDDRRYRLKGLAQGEVAIYTDEDQSGHRIHLKRGNEIHLIAGASSIVIKPSGITLAAPAVDVVKV